VPEENPSSPSGIRTREWRAPRWQEIAGTLVPDFGLGTAASELDASLWLAAHEDHKLRVLTGLQARRIRIIRWYAAGAFNWPNWCMKLGLCRRQITQVGTIFGMLFARTDWPFRQRSSALNSHVLRHHLVATARFITILPKATIEVLGKSLSIRALPVRLPATERTVTIVVLKKRTLSPIAQVFIETLRAVAKPGTKTRKNAS